MAGRSGLSLEPRPPALNLLAVRPAATALRPSPSLKKMGLMSSLHRKRWVCQLCNKSLSSKRSYTEHQYTHNNLRPYACEFCSYAAASNMTLRRHILRHHAPRQAWGYQCPYCSEGFVEPASFQMHVVSYHRGCSATLGCPSESCRFVTKSSRHFRQHLQKHVYKQPPPSSADKHRQTTRTGVAPSAAMSLSAASVSGCDADLTSSSGDICHPSDNVTLSRQSDNVVIGDPVTTSAGSNLSNNMSNDDTSDRALVRSPAVSLHVTITNTRPFDSVTSSLNCVTESLTSSSLRSSSQRSDNNKSVTTSSSQCDATTLMRSFTSSQPDITKHAPQPMTSLSTSSQRDATKGTPQSLTSSSPSSTSHDVSKQTPQPPTSSSSSLCAQMALRWTLPESVRQCRQLVRFTVTDDIGLGYHERQAAERERRTAAARFSVATSDDGMGQQKQRVFVQAGQQKLIITYPNHGQSADGTDPGRLAGRIPERTIKCGQFARIGQRREPMQLGSPLKPPVSNSGRSTVEVDRKLYQPTRSNSTFLSGNMPLHANRASPSSYRLPLPVKTKTSSINSSNTAIRFGNSSRNTKPLSSATRTRPPCVSRPLPGVQQRQKSSHHPHVALKGHRSPQSNTGAPWLYDDTAATTLNGVNDVTTAVSTLNDADQYDANVANQYEANVANQYDANQADANAESMEVIEEVELDGRTTAAKRLENGFEDYDVD